jgi:hypothetical protein
LEKSLKSAASFSLSREFEDEARARLGDLSPEVLTPTELLQMYFKTRNVEPERIEVLVEKAKALLE